MEALGDPYSAEFLPRAALSLVAAAVTFLLFLSRNHLLNLFIQVERAIKVWKEGFITLESLQTAKGGIPRAPSGPGWKFSKEFWGESTTVFRLSIDQLSPAEMEAICSAARAASKTLKVSAESDEENVQEVREELKLDPRANLVRRRV